MHPGRPCDTHCGTAAESRIVLACTFLSQLNMHGTWPLNVRRDRSSTSCIRDWSILARRSLESTSSLKIRPRRREDEWRNMLYICKLRSNCNEPKVDVLMWEAAHSLSLHLSNRVAEKFCHRLPNLILTEFEIKKLDTTGAAFLNSSLIWRVHFTNTFN